MRTLVFTLALVATTVHAGGVPSGWKTYRSEQFGWELSYPHAMELKAYLGGASADLRDAITGRVLAELELWPSDVCPRERPGTTAEGIGTERVAAVTQADGDDGASSWSTRSVSIRAWRSERIHPTSRPSEASSRRLRRSRCPIRRSSA